MSTNRPATIDPAAIDYVLPAPPRGGAEVVVVAPRRDVTAVLRRGGEVARTLGDRFLALAESQQLFLEELRDRLDQLDGAIAETPRALLKGAVRETLAVLDWCDTVQADLVAESRQAARGAEPIDVAALCREVAAGVHLDDQPVVVVGRQDAPWWGDAAALADVVRLGLGLVAERTQGHGARSLEIAEAPGAVRLWLASHGEPGDGVEPDSVERFRAAVQRLGATVRPDALGPGSSGLVIELPRA